MRRLLDNILKYFSGNMCEGMDWTLLAQNRVHWQAFVNTIMNLWVP